MSVCTQSVRDVSSDLTAIAVPITVFVKSCSSVQPGISRSGMSFRVLSKACRSCCDNRVIALRTNAVLFVMSLGRELGIVF